MNRLVPRAILVMLLALAACAPEPPPPEDPLPLPPPPPPLLRGGRIPAAPPPAADAAGEVPGEATGPDGTPAPEGVAEAAPVWRVQRDGTVGCADPAALRLLSDRTDASPRILAEARAAGGCRTTFRINEWARTASEGDLIQLRLTSGPALTLWFRRDELTAP
jgi:hypothetical protein